MDKQRIVILAALGVVVWLLIMAWQKDYGNPTRETAELTTELGLEGTKEVTSQFIDIETPLVFAKINPKGGDLVFLALKKYPESKDQPDNAFVLLENNDQVINVVQSGLIGQNGINKVLKEAPVFSAEKTKYQIEQGNLVVPLSFEHEGVSYEKTYTFHADDYLIDVDYTVNNASSNALLVKFYGQLKRNSADDPSSANAGFIPLPTFLGGAYGTPEETFNKLTFDDFNDDNPKVSTEGGWIAMVQHYFLSAWIPSEQGQHRLSTRQKGEMNYVTFEDEQVLINPNTSQTLGAQLYVGPKIQERLSEIKPGLEQTVDYGFLWFIAKYLFAGLKWIYGLVGNWGLAIIGLTFLIKLALYPLSYSSYKSMAKMRKFAPKMKILREKYKDDRQKLSQEMMALYKKEKISPMGGCLPILLQMPVFLSLYWVLLESVELRQSPFLWIQDLSLLDPFFILPLLMGVSMYFQMKLNPTPQDPMQQSVMKWMPWMFTILFLWFPAGLVLYWLTNNVLTIAQQWWINRSLDD
ncbi:MAG: membrane protein insertase YidC [Pseudomonadota bacterium]|nr:membrane protein insertase YidC [Pseudomonadota bacterium]